MVMFPQKCTVLAVLILTLAAALEYDDEVGNSGKNKVVAILEAGDSSATEVHCSEDLNYNVQY